MYYRLYGDFLGEAGGTVELDGHTWYRTSKGFLYRTDFIDDSYTLIIYGKNNLNIGSNKQSNPYSLKRLNFKKLFIYAAIVIIAYNVLKK